MIILVTPLVYSNVFAAASFANTETPRFPVLNQTITQQSASPIEVIWQAQDKYRIQISQNNGIYNGKIIWFSPGTETKGLKKES